VNETYGYNADRLQLTSQSAVKGANTLMSLTYNYAATAGASGASTTAGNTGQLMSIGGTINSLSRSQAFTYDNVGRLLTATGWSVWNRRFAYDRWGNRTGMWDALSGGNQLQNIAIALTNSVANNRIANVNGVTYTYDASGNCTWDGAHSYAYDGEGRQVNVDSGATATSAYDSNNWRVKKVAGGVTTHYVWEGSQVIAEYNGSTGALISEYILVGSRMLARDQGGMLRYYHPDQLSTRMITDSMGVVIGTEDHLPFGEDAGTTGETEKHRFTTYDRDSESGADYAVNRQYLFATGRFNRPDVFSGSIGAPQSLNRYSYVTNDPMNSADPSGLVGESVWGLYWGTTMGLGGGGFGFGQEDYDFWGYRIADLPGFGTMWGSLPQLEEWRYGVLVRTNWLKDPAFPSTGEFDYDNLVGPSITTGPQQQPLRCQPEVIKAMNKAWSQSGNAGQAHPGSTPVEAGFNLNGSPSNYQVSSFYTNEVGKMSIKYNNLNSPNPTFANFHVHPKGFDGNNGFPSTPKSNYEGNGKGDTGAFDDIYHQTQNGIHQAIQVYVMSWQGLAMYDPATRNSTQLVKGTGFLKGEGCAP